MVRIGEETGNLGPLLGDLCRIYDLQLEAALATFTAMLEPLVMLMTGGMVALMVGATMLPIMKVISTL